MFYLKKKKKAEIVFNFQIDETTMKQKTSKPFKLQSAKQFSSSKLIVSQFLKYNFPNIFASAVEVINSLDLEQMRCRVTKRLIWIQTVYISNHRIASSINPLLRLSRLDYIIKQVGSRPRSRFCFAYSSMLDFRNDVTKPFLLLYLATTEKIPPVVTIFSYNGKISAWRECVSEGYD